MSKITIKNSTIVVPAEETPRRVIWLSSLDWMVMPVYRHSSAVFVYQLNDNNNFFDVQTLKTTLSRALVPFYPMAGRLKTNEQGKLEIDCNAEGALFMEAEAKESLAEFGPLTPDYEPKKWLIPKCDFSKGISSFPLLMVQVTRFSCGGVALGVGQHHQAGDGTAHMHFINSWARMVRGLDLDTLPNFDRIPYLTPRIPPKISFPLFDSEYGPHQGLLIAGENPQLKMIDETSPTMVSLFNLTKDQISDLKVKAKSTLPEEVRNDYNPTTYEVLASHVWRCACKARELAEDQEVRLFIPTNGRQRLKNPPLPQGFYGNVTFYPACIAKAGEITSNPLGYVAAKVHKTIVRVNDEEYLRSTIDYLESHPNMVSLIRGQHKLMCPNMNINSWTRLPFDEANFGWGKPVYVGIGSIAFEGQSFITANINGDGGVGVSIKLFTVHMTSFHKYFYDF